MMSGAPAQANPTASSAHRAFRQPPGDLSRHRAPQLTQRNPSGDRIDNGSELPRGGPVHLGVDCIAELAYEYLKARRSLPLQIDASGRCLT
jgi:hypothetical protein